MEEGGLGNVGTESTDMLNFTHVLQERFRDVQGAWAQKHPTCFYFSAPRVHGEFMCSAFDALIIQDND
jgi:hypothetical protein